MLFVFWLLIFGSLLFLGQSADPCRNETVLTHYCTLEQKGIVGGLKEKELHIKLSAFNGRFVDDFYFFLDIGGEELSFVWENFDDGDYHFDHQGMALYSPIYIHITANWYEVTDHENRTHVDRGFGFGGSDGDFWIGFGVRSPLPNLVVQFLEGSKYAADVVDECPSWRLWMLSLLIFMLLMVVVTVIVMAFTPMCCQKLMARRRSEEETPLLEPRE